MSGRFGQVAVGHFPLHQLPPGLLAHPAATALALDQLKRRQIGRLIHQFHKAPGGEQLDHIGVAAAGTACTRGGHGSQERVVVGDILQWFLCQGERSPNLFGFLCGSMKQGNTVLLHRPMAPKQRLDLELVARGLADSRQQAQQLIRAGMVRSGDQVLDKPGTEVRPEQVLQVAQRPRFVSRGGDKLAAALEAFALQVAGRVCLDGGISTGGFSDCLLQAGAARVYGIDVGYGQTAWSLRSDPRVVLKERTNLRHLTPEQLYGEDDPWPDLAVADVSFISLALVLPALVALLRPQGPQQPLELVLLVKPQFEVGKGRVGKGGVVRDPLAHIEAIERVCAAAASLTFSPAGVVASPITGPAGNHEYLLWLKQWGPEHQGPKPEAPTAAAIAQLVHQTLSS
jgi:23S rRNA (cytidine1920-2'-O)/16S rRNA (cytidine1409-2'-O)-methyltransferase